LPVIDANQDSMRTVLERRGAYAKLMPAHVVFPRYFQRGIVDNVRVAAIEVGVLRVPSGKIVVADPVYFGDSFTQPFKREILPGAYPVDLVIADLGPWGNRVAFGRLSVSPEDVQMWEMAETDAPGEFNVFIGVDGGMVGFADSQAASIFARVQKDFAATHPTGNYYEDVLSSDFPPDSNWGEHYPDPASPLSVIVASSGLGDGLYRAYWGLDGSGVPAQLVVDFQLFDEHGTIVRK
jgi:hypothetical protein